MPLVTTSLSMAHNETHSFSPGTTSEILKSERVNQFLNESEELVRKLMAEIALKFQNLILEEAATLSRVKTVSFSPPPPPPRAK